MSIEKNIKTDFLKINPDLDLTQDETGEILKLTNNFNGNNLKNKLNQNKKLKNLINFDYNFYNTDILNAYKRHGVNMSSLQSSFVKLGFDLGTFGKANNGVDGSFGLMTFLAIIKLQKILGVKATGKLDLNLICYLFPRTFRTRNKNEGLGKNSREVNDLLNKKIDLYNKHLKNKKEIQTSIKQNAQEIQVAIKKEIQDQYDPKQKIEKNQIDTKQKIEEIITKNFLESRGISYRKKETINTNENSFINFVGHGDIYTSTGVTACAGINRKTLGANGVNGFWYTANGGDYNYTDNILNPKTRDSNIFRKEKMVTEPKKIFLSSDFGSTRNKNYLRNRADGFIKETILSDFSKIDNQLVDGEMISIIMDSNTKSGRKWGHMATGMKIKGELYIVDPVLLLDHKAITYYDYMNKINSSNNLKIKGIIVYDESNNTNETYLASIRQKQSQVARG